MSIIINKTDISNIKQFRNDLIVYPKSANPRYTKKNSEIYLYTNEGEGNIRVPYWYGTNIIGKNKTIYPVRDFQFTGTLREKQITVAEEASEQLELYNTTLLHLFPGFGKTILGAYHASKLGHITLVVMTIKQLITQWQKTFTDCTNAIVITIKTSQKIWESNFDVIICMSSQIVKIPPDIRSKIGTVIVDEAHMFCTSKLYKELSLLTPKYLILETATPFRTDGLHNILHRLSGPHEVYRKCDKDFTVMKYSTGIRVKEYWKGNDLDYVTTAKETGTIKSRNEQIISLVQHYHDKKIIILTGYIDHIKELGPMLDTIGENYDEMYGLKKNYQEKRILIGTVGKIGTGFDPSASCDNFSGEAFNLVILATSIKSKAPLTQYVGRGLRSDNPIIIHMVDDNKIFRNHWEHAGKQFYSTETNATIIHSDKRLFEGQPPIIQGIASEITWRNISHIPTTIEIGKPISIALRC